MTRSIFIYGAIAGLITVSAIIVSMQLSNSLHLANAVWLGYAIMVLALLLIFVSVKRHRDEKLDGFIPFWRAFFMGLGIAVVASLFYVIGWETYLAATNYAFLTEYADIMATQSAETGASEEQLAIQSAQLADAAIQYAKPSFRVPITFLEIFPVGLVIALISAAILRKNPHQTDD